MSMADLIGLAAASCLNGAECSDSVDTTACSPFRSEHEDGAAWTVPRGADCTELLGIDVPCMDCGACMAPQRGLVLVHGWRHERTVC